MNLAAKQQELIEDYSIIDDPIERFQVIVDGADRKLQPYPEEYRSEKYLVPGCRSNVWLVGWLEQDGAKEVFQLRMDSDAPALKGVASLLCELYSGAEKSEVSQVEPEFISKLKIDQILTSTRRRGLGMVRERMIEFSENDRLS